MNSMAAAIYEDFLKNNLDGKITDTGATRLNKVDSFPSFPRTSCYFS